MPGCTEEASGRVTALFAVGYGSVARGACSKRVHEILQRASEAVEGAVECETVGATGKGDLAFDTLVVGEVVFRVTGQAEITALADNAAHHDRPTGYTLPSVDVKAGLALSALCL